MDRLDHEFVHYIPGDLIDGVLYVSIPFATAVHRCCSGCGNEVVTPLDPTDWQLVFDGISVSLFPSIGTGVSTCRSHYRIRRNQVRWIPHYSEEQIVVGREHDHFEKAQQSGSIASLDADGMTNTPPSTRRKTFWRFLSKWVPLVGLC